MGFLISLGLLVWAFILLFGVLTSNEYISRVDSFNGQVSAWNGRYRDEFSGLNFILSPQDGSSVVLTQTSIEPAPQGSVPKSKDHRVTVSSYIPLLNSGIGAPFPPLSSIELDANSNITITPQNGSTGATLPSFNVISPIFRFQLMPQKTQQECSTLNGAWIRTNCFQRKDDNFYVWVCDCKVYRSLNNWCIRIQKDHLTGNWRMSTSSVDGLGGGTRGCVGAPEESGFKYWSPDPPLPPPFTFPPLPLSIRSAHDPYIYYSMMRGFGSTNWEKIQQFFALLLLSAFMVLLFPSCMICLMCQRSFKVTAANSSFWLLGNKRGPSSSQERVPLVAPNGAREDPMSNAVGGSINAFAGGGGAGGSGTEFQGSS